MQTALLSALERLIWTAEIVGTSNCILNKSRLQHRTPRQTLPSGIDLPQGHTMDVLELCVGLDGSFDLEFENHDIIIHRNELVILLPGEFHREKIRNLDTSYDVLWITFFAPRISLHLKRYKSSCGYDILSAMELIPNHEVFECLKMLMLEAMSNRQAWNITCAGLIKTISAYLMRSLQNSTHTELQHSQITVSGYDQLQQAVDFIQKNYKSDICLEDVASSVHLSPTYFSSLFKKTYGTTFNQYLTDIRLAEAHKLLQWSDLSLQEIAEKVGYRSQSYLTRVFKKRTGETPSTYRDTLGK